MTLIELYHLKCEAIKRLSELTLEQIEDVHRNFQKMHPEDYPYYRDLFIRAEQRKHDELKIKEIIALVEEIKNTPPDATNI